MYHTVRITHWPFLVRKFLLHLFVWKSCFVGFLWAHSSEGGVCSSGEDKSTSFGRSRRNLTHEHEDASQIIVPHCFLWCPVKGSAKGTQTLKALLHVCGWLVRNTKTSQLFLPVHHIQFTWCQCCWQGALFHKSLNLTLRAGHLVAFIEFASFKCLLWFLCSLMRMPLTSFPLRLDRPIESR